MEEHDLYKVLQKYFGFSTFRDSQLAAIQAALRGITTLINTLPCTQVLVVSSLGCATVQDKIALCCCPLEVASPCASACLRW